MVERILWTVSRTIADLWKALIALKAIICRSLDREN